MKENCPSSETKLSNTDLCQLCVGLNVFSEGEKGLNTNSCVHLGSNSSVMEIRKRESSILMKYFIFFVSVFKSIIAGSFQRSSFKKNGFCSPN